MTLVLIVLLVLLWGAVIVPTLLRVRQSPSYSVGAFRRNMQALGSRSAGRPSRRSSGSGTAGRWILGPPPRPGSAAYRQSAAARPPQRRPAPRGYSQRRRPARGGVDAGGLTMDQRRTIFFMLLTAAAFTLMLGLAFSLLLRIHLGVDIALLGYAVYLVRTKPRRRAPREAATFYPPAARRAGGQQRAGDDRREWLRAGEL
ncbi:MAG TPA: hypothetical protein VG779_07670 [Actinomycetota bacterium]|nr:hypothetical protein [Actinomycetota bacterium]